MLEDQGYVNVFQIYFHITEITFLHDSFFRNFLDLKKICNCLSSFGGLGSVGHVQCNTEVGVLSSTL